MLEMACVSFNKVRLQYYVSKKDRRALWISYLINNSPLLFGTTLIGVNTALQIGSECSRRLYESLGLSPDIAPLTQVIAVLIFAEIVPMTIGRRYAEYVAMLGVPFLYFSSIVLRPLIWFFDIICRLASRLMGSPKETRVYLSREELQRILEQREETKFFSLSSSEEFNTIVSNIFSLKNKTAKEWMQPLKAIRMVSSFCTIGEMRKLLSEDYTPYLPIYHRNAQHVVAIAYPRDLLRLGDNKKVRDHARSAWFITENNSILQILKQFRRNNQSIAVVLNESGLATGILSLDEIIDELFGRSDKWESFEEIAPRMHHIVVDKSFAAETLIADFNKQFSVHLESHGAKTLEELMHTLLGHSPSQGETVRIDQFELTAEQVSLLGTTWINVRTVY